jgi:hypothetical protein
MLTSGWTPGSADTAVTFTAAVWNASMHGGAPTGTVQFRLGTKMLAEQPLISGLASFSTTSLNLRDDAVVAVYSGDANFVGIASEPVSGMHSLAVS